MQFSRSLFAVLALGSLISVSAKAELDKKLAAVAAAVVGVAYLNERQVDDKKTDVVSKVLNTGSSVVQTSFNFVKKHAVNAALLGALGFVLYHNTEVHKTHAFHKLTHFLHSAEHVARHEADHIRNAVQAANK